MPAFYYSGGILLLEPPRETGCTSRGSALVSAGVQRRSVHDLKCIALSRQSDQKWAYQKSCSLGLPINPLSGPGWNRQMYWNAEAETSYDEAWIFENVSKRWLAWVRRSTKPWPDTCSLSKNSQWCVWTGHGRSSRHLSLHLRWMKKTFSGVDLAAWRHHTRRKRRL